MSLRSPVLLAPAPATAPSHATLPAGQEVQRHGVKLSVRTDRANKVHGLLEKHLAELPRVHDNAPLSDETRCALQALGYLE